MRIFDPVTFEFCEDLRVIIILNDDSVYDCLVSCWEEYSREINPVTRYPEMEKWFLFQDLSANYLMHDFGYGLTRVYEHDIKMWEHYGRN